MTDLLNVAYTGEADARVIPVSSLKEFGIDMPEELRWERGQALALPASVAQTLVENIDDFEYVDVAQPYPTLPFIDARSIDNELSPEGAEESEETD